MRLASLLIWAAAALLAVCALSGMLEPVAALFRFIPRGYNEGWNAYWADIAWHGGRLYPPVDGAIADNYPPVSFYVIGALGRLVGDNIFAGRLLALLSLIVIAINIWAWLSIAGFSRSIAVFAAVLFVAVFVNYAQIYVAYDDPQLFAQAMITTGTTVLWRFDFSTRALAGASALMVLGGLTKHLPIALPLAVTVWIAIYRRPRLLAWLLTSAATLAVALALIWLSYGSAFFENLASGRGYAALSAQHAVIEVLRSMRFVLIVGAAALLACASRFSSMSLRQYAALALIYAALAAAVGVLAAGGTGVDRNAFFDLAIAACLLVAVVLEHLRSRPALIADDAGNAALIASAALVLAVLYAREAAHRWPGDWRTLRQERHRETEAVADIRAIGAVGRGAAACETLALCYWAGKAFTVDFFTYGQKLEANRIHAASCESVFSRSSIALLQLESPDGDVSSRRLTPSCNDLIARLFAPIVTSPYGTLLLRR